MSSATWNLEKETTYLILKTSFPLGYVVEGQNSTAHPFPSPGVATYHTLTNNAVKVSNPGLLIDVINSGGGKQYKEKASCIFANMEPVLGVFSGNPSDTLFLEAFCPYIVNFTKI